ncbi:glycosyltransferase family 4 protein [Candidatus Uhrbacteria bacterium]|nr:glycosyltransferase family 4 protein [Candidatus Uhrbacteria bacterium]
MRENRLLLLTPDFPPNNGGVARYLSKLATHFSSRILVISSVKNSAQTTPFPVLEQQLLNPFFWPKWIESVRLFFTFRQSYDIALLSHVLPFGTAAFFSSLFTKKQYVIFVHGMDVRLACSNFIKKQIAKVVFKHARVVVANSRSLAQEVAEIFDVTLPLVVYPCLESVTKTQSHLTTDRELSVITLRFLTVSRLVKRKGHTQVLMALAELKKSKSIPSFQYDIVGDGPMLQTLKDLAGQFHLDEVVFHGLVNDEQLVNFYMNADIFLMPVIDDVKDKEGFGFVFIEAANYEVPSISTQISGINEAIINNQTGLLVKPNDHEDLCRAISVLSNSTEMRIRLGKQAKEHVEQNFTCSQQFAKLEPYL